MDIIQVKYFMDQKWDDWMMGPINQRAMTACGFDLITILQWITFNRGQSQQAP